MLEVTTKPVPTLGPRMLAVGWLATGALLAVGGAMRHVPQVGPVFLLASLAMWITVYRRGGATRQWLDSFPLRPLLALHILRLPIGVLFLYEASQGRLSDVFANRAGIGDIVIGVLAIGAVAASRSRAIVRAFSVFGLADIFLALGTGMYLRFVVHEPHMIAAFEHRGYALLPLALVPTVILAHLLVLARR